MDCYVTGLLLFSDASCYFTLRQASFFEKPLSPCLYLEMDALEIFRPLFTSWSRVQDPTLLLTHNISFHAIVKKILVSIVDKQTLLSLNYNDWLSPLSDTTTSPSQPKGGKTWCSKKKRKKEEKKKIFHFKFWTVLFIYTVL